MDDVEQQIKAWADAAAPPTGESIDAADVIGGRVALATPTTIDAVRRGRERWLAVAAAVFVVAAVGIGLAIQARHDEGEQVHASDPPTATTTTESQTSVPAGGPADVRFDVLGSGSTSEDRIGTLAVAQSADELAQLWADAGLEAAVPEIDFDEQVVVSLTRADDACRATLSAVTRLADMVEPQFDEPLATCEQPLVPTTHVAALDWASTGDEFLLVLNGARPQDDQESLLVTREATAGQGTEGQVTPAAGVTATLALDSTEVPVGGTLAGVITVVNESGHPIEGTTCGDYFVGALGNDGYHQGIARRSCLGPFTIPQGTSTYPVEVLATISGCTPLDIRPTGDLPSCNPDGSMPALRPGEYQLTIDDPQHLVPPFPPVTVTVT